MSNPAYHLFQCYGIEIEYMIVNRTGLNVQPIADQLLRAEDGQVVSDLEFESIAWSNELLAHVIELKTNGPVASLTGIEDRFQENVNHINQKLATFDCRLMPTGMHPWMDPGREKKLWEHDNHTVYATFDRIFNCTGHGWANLQSMHINLPFHDDREFALLHSAIRLVLPLLPSLAASSPIVERTATEFADNRMEYYRNNSKAIPEIAGVIVPELILSQQQYEKEVLQPIYSATAGYDPEAVLRHEWCNSRGAIARFQRNAIEIRVIDAQECPAMDLAIAELTIVLLKHLVENKAEQIMLNSPATDLKNLSKLMLDSIRLADLSEIELPGFLTLFDLPDEVLKAQTFWRMIFERFENQLSYSARTGIEIICEQGPLSRRIVNSVGQEQANLHNVYQSLCDCLAQGKSFTRIPMG